MSVVVRGSGQKNLTQVQPGHFFVAWVGSGQPFMIWAGVWKISPKNVKFFNFFPFASKKNILGSASYLLRVKSKLESGQGPSLE